MLPNTIDPIKLAKHQSVLEGELPLNTLPRLQEIEDQANQVAQVKLKFDTESHRIVIHGDIDATINVTCQRCNEMMTYPLHHLFSLSPVTTDAEAKKLSEDIEPIMMKNEMISVNDMIEEEILLALPMVTKHEVC